MSAASRISVEVAGSSLSLQEAVGKAAASLKELGSVLGRQTDLALTAGAKTVRANELVARSYQQTAVQAGAASAKTVAAFERQGAVALDSSKTQIRAAEQAATASKAASDRIVVGLDEQSLAAMRAANTHVAAGRRAAQSFGSSSSAISKAGKVISLGLLGAAAASLDLAVRFQSNTLRIQTQAGATSSQLEKLRKGILAMAPAVGIGPNQLANGMYHVVSSMNAVLPPTQRVSGELKVLRYAAELATVGHSNLEETTYALASAMNALHAPISQTAKVTGELNAIVGAGDMTMTDLIDSFKSGLVPSARIAGISLQSLGSALAVMGDMGMRGALAGTRLRMSIALLSSPSAAAAKVLQTLGLSSKEATSTSEAMSKALEKAGLRTTTLSADLRQPNGIMVALHDLNQHLQASGLTATGAAAVMNKAFGGGRMGATITLLAQNTDRLDTKFHQIGQSAGHFGADWQKASHTTAFELHSLEAGVLSLGTSLGTDLLPALNTGVHDLTDVVHWFEQGNSAAHALELTIGTLATVAIGSYLISQLRKAITLMREFGQVAMHPVSSVGGFARSTAPGPVGGGAGLAAVSGGIVGARGPEMPGSIANPIIVAIEAGQFAGLSSMGAAGTVATEQKLAAAETGALSKGGVVLPPGVASAAGPAAAETAAGLGMMGTFKSMLGSLLKAGGIAGIGVLGAQAAGGLLGGNAGKAVSSVGSGAAIGAGLGSLLGPEGTIAGGITGALIAGVGHFLSGPSPEEEGKQFADKFTRDLPGKVTQRTKDALAKTDAKTRTDAQQATEPQVGPGGRKGGGRPGAMFARAPTQDKKILADSLAEGKRAGDAFVQGMQSVKFPTQIALTQDMSMKLNQVPAEIRAKGPKFAQAWQDSAAKQMIAYAAGLVRNGKLPARQLDGIIASLENEFPQLASFLEQQGLNTANVIARTMKLDAAQKNWRTALSTFRSQWGDEAISLKITSDNINSNTVKAMAFLKDVIAHGSKDQRAAAEKEYTLLQQHVHSTFDSMTTDVVAKQTSMTGTIQKGTASAAKTAGQNLADFEHSVTSAMSSGILSATDGANKIGAALNATLKAFKAKPIPLAALIASEAKHMPTFIGGGHAGTFAAGGGYIGSRGENGRDTVHAILGRGEAVLKHQDQAIVNQALSRTRYGSLDGVYSATAGQKHWMDSGGYAGMGPAVPFATGGLGSPGAGGSGTGGDVYPFPPGTSLGRVDDGQDAGMPVGAPIGPIGPARYGGQRPWGGAAGNQPIMWWQLVGGPRQGAWVYLAEQITPKPWSGILQPNQAAATFSSSGTNIEMGWMAPGTSATTLAQAQGHGGEAPSPEGSDFANFIAGLARGVITGGGGGGALGSSAVPWQNIPVPGVKGTGTVSDLVRASLKQMTAAANAYGSSHAGAPTAGAFSGLGGSASANEALGHKMMLAWGWGEDQWPSLDKLWIGESNWSDTAMNTPSMGWLAAGNASGIPQSDGNGQVYASGDAAGQIAWGLNYIRQRYGSPSVAYSDWLGRSPHWYEEGGFVEAMAGAGRAGKVSHSTRTSSKKPPKVKNPKHHKPTKPGKLPTLKSLKGFDETLLNEILTMENVTIADLIGWQGYVDSLHRAVPSQALVTLSDGSQVLNPNGMIDPSTNTWVKGISQRLQEIGQPGNLDISTELGIEDQLLADYLQEQQWAGQAYKEFGPWLSNMTRQVAIDAQENKWVTRALDPTVTWEQLSGVNPFIAIAGDQGAPGARFFIPGAQKFARELKNKLAQVEWATKLKEQLPLEEQKRKAKLTARFATAKHKVETSSLTSSFDGSQLLSEQEHQLSEEERSALAGITSATPRGWKGDRQAWDLEHKRERADITDEFAGRLKALRDAAAKHKLDGQLSRSNALFALGQEEAADKLAVSQKYGHRKIDLTDLIRGDTRTEGADKRWLSSVLSQIKSNTTGDQASLTAATTPVSGFGDTLKEYLNPMGQLSRNILTSENINIPNLLREIADLNGTTVPAGTGTGTSSQDSQLLALYQQLNLQLSQTVALNEAQTSVLQGMLPMIPRYDKGGPVIDDGLAMLHRDEFVVPRGGALVAGGGGGAQTFQLHQHYNGDRAMGALLGLIDQRIRHPDNVRAVSGAIGVRTSMLTGAPGSRSRF